MAILEWSDVDKFEYRPESRDCDNFAIALTGQLGHRLGANGVGLIVDGSGNHAYACLLVSDPDGGIRVTLVEPQSDGTVRLGDRLGGHEAYKAEEGFILLG